ncbi:SGNH/GDSL hydrolase family protein [Leifsonia sp. NPDC058292]|uniref:SGNH/GDSL hydrolase family protein n=1 Tax=Leifsonia sp. NPDC058292 TaxID=3346428 RepID=UPI0036D950B5
MAKKRNVALVTAGLSTAAVGVGAWAGIRRAQERLALNRTAMNETLPVHSKWWRDVAKTEGELLYVALGDSAAQGIGASAPKNSYVGVIADHIRATTGRTVQVVNLSVSGATVALAVADQLPRFATFQPDVVTVAIGANDIAAFDPALFEAGIRKVFAALPDHAIVADLPCFYLPWNEKKVAVGNRILRQVAAERGLTVVPLHDTMKRQGLRGVVTQFAQDLFHPNDHGYRVWASAFLPTVTARVTKLFPRRPKASEAARPDTDAPDAVGDLAEAPATP